MRLFEEEYQNMKKSSLMGASVVAAALLAAAPVVAPVASLATPATQEVKAASDPQSETINKLKQGATGTTLLAYNGENEAEAPFGTVTDFKNNALTSANLKKLLTGDFLDTSSSHKFVDSDVITSEGNKVTAANSLLRYFLNGTQGVDLMNTSNRDYAATLRYTLSFKYSNAIGNDSHTLTSNENVANLISDLTTNGGSITMTMQLYNAANQPISEGVVTSTVSYNVKNNRAAYVSYNDSLNAKVNDSADVFALSNSFVNAGGKILNYNGQDITQAAYNAGAITITPLHDANGHLATESGVAANGNFVKTGTFYQRIKIDLNSIGLKLPNDSWADAVKNGLITVNGQKPSITNADANVFLTTKPGTDATTTVDGDKVNTGVLVLKRTVNVGSANLATKDEKVNGIVTVHTSDVTTAPLYDEDGNVIVDRSLINNSRWTTDTKRTVYANGKVFYRVSTHEYVSADQVTFEPTDTSSSSDVVKGDVVVTPLPSRKVIQASYAGSVTDLWNKSDDNKSMTRSADRHLAGGTLWQTDQTATVNGVTYYRVSTNEWVAAKYAILQ